jgi:predicted small lipoprotein YifL
MNGKLCVKLLATAMVLFVSLSACGAPAPSPPEDLVALSDYDVEAPMDVEEVGEEQANELFQAASQPERMEWYDAGRALHTHEDATHDRLDWLRTELGLARASK